MGLNRTNVELKRILLLPPYGDKEGLNRTNVELKHASDNQKLHRRVLS